LYSGLSGGKSIFQEALGMTSPMAYVTPFVLAVPGLPNAFVNAINP
jgi:hypothetical protein